MIDRADMEQAPLTALTPEQLACRAQAGCRASFAELVTRFHARLLNFLHHRTGGSADPEDLAQDAFTRAWQNIHTYSPRWRFSTWLYSIATRLAIDHFRARRPRQLDGQQDRIQSDGADPARAADQHEQHCSIWSAAAELLTDAQRTVLWLRYAEDLSMKDIARATGKSQISVRVTLFRARSILAERCAATTGQALQASKVAPPEDLRACALEVCDA
jgi:RNA polymerase sigma-70 factor (ECF subfamily)